MSLKQLSLCFGLLILLAAPRMAPAGDVVVYDNTGVHTSGGYATDGVWAFNVFEAYGYMGDQVTLSVSDATISRFDLMLYSTEAATAEGVQVALFPIDTTTFEIGAPYWTSDPRNVEVGADEVTVVTFDVPDVAVPQELVWAAAGDSDVAGLATMDPPSVGSSASTYYWNKAPEPEGWIPLNLGSEMAANFGARIWAVPEPTGLVVLLSGCAGLIARRRRRTA